MAWNLAGIVLPLIVALIAVPPLTVGLGDARFALLSLAWIFIGYFTIFDFGFSLSLTQLVSRRIAAGQQDTLPGLIGTALAFCALFASACGVVIALSAPAAISLMKVPPDLEHEAIGALRLLGLSVPVVILGTVLRGLMEALQRFREVNLVRIVSSVYLLAMPLAMLPFTRQMTWIIGALLAGKALASLAFGLICWRALPELRRALRWDRAELRHLFLFGGWITAGNLLGPLLSSLDHFLIGALVALPLVVYYSVPHQMMIRLWPLIAAVVGVLFPAMSIHLHSDRARAGRLFLLGLKAPVLLILPLTLTVAMFADHILLFWLGKAYAEASATLLKLFALGVTLNSFNFVMLALVQAAGRPDWVPKLGLLELPLYPFALMFGIEQGGLIGAALVWLLRIVIELCFLLWAVPRVLPEIAPTLRRARLGLAAMALAFAPAFLPLHIDLQILCWTVLSATIAWTGWARLLLAEERAMIAARLRSLVQTPR